MIKKLFFVGALLTLSDYSIAQQTGIDSSYINGHYLQRMEFFRKMPDQKNEVVFLGNSITEGGKWQELFPKKPVINRGISGDVTYGVLARLDEVLSSKPAKIFLLIGINDMKRGIPSPVILNNYQKIIDIVKKISPDTKLFIQSILPVNKKMLPASYDKLTNIAILDMNAHLKTMCKENNLRYIDLHEVFSETDGEMKKELTIDGLHLKSASYILWSGYLKKIDVL